MPGDFNSLSTVSFQQKMKPYANKIYENIFPGCKIVDLRKDGKDAHILDKEFAIDSLIYLKNGNWISIQEKYRKNSALYYEEFTQEHMNAYGTPHQTEGEWFKLGAQLYFYGFSNKNETDFEKWALMDIARYKMYIESKGGIEKGGWPLKFNKTHGRASFYAIRIRELLDAGCLVTDHYSEYLKQNPQVIA
jgi:hypothetical protein